MSFKSCLLISDISKNPEYGPSAFAVLTMFGPGGLLHTAFDHFEFWLEEVPNQPHTYNVCVARERFFTYTDRPPRRVTFQVDPAIVVKCAATGIPVPALPSPTLLALRASCARVAHMSDAVEQFDQIFVGDPAS
ncbi:hypothetical protein B0H10DRAFT_691962 [Mycena sp. CBHHK59/15]|nr:hypothetical protein B0H10DRAFT_691962 [Mycena sp. CBHHK59/15]